MRTEGGFPNKLPRQVQINKWQLRWSVCLHRGRRLLTRGVATVLHQCANAPPRGLFANCSVHGKMGKVLEVGPWKDVLRLQISTR